MSANLVGHVFATIAGGDTSFATLPDDTEVGDEMITVLLADDLNAFAVVPEGWSSLAGSLNTGTYRAMFFHRTVTQEDLDDLVSRTWESSGAVSPDPAGVLVVARGVPGGPLVPNVAPNPRAVENLAATVIGWASPVATQADDLRLIVIWLIASGATLTDTASLQVEGEAATADGRIVLGRSLKQTPGESDSDAVTYDVLGDGVAVGLNLRSRPVATPVGLADPIPGTIGLVLEGGEA